MMRNGWVTGAAGLVLGVGLAAGEAAAFSATYDQKMTHGRDVYQSRVALKDELFRMDMTVQGQASVVLHNAEGTYTIMPGEGMAMKTGALRPGQQPIRGVGNYAQYLADHHAERLGAETVDGHACDIYRFTDPEAGGLTTVWVWKEKTFPVKFETEDSGGKTLVELSNIQLDANLPDDTFKLPTGIQVMDMGALMNVH